MIRISCPRPRLLSSIAIGLAVWWLLPVDMRHSTRLLISWDMVVAFYLGLIAWMMHRSDTNDIRCRAAEYDEGRLTILTLTTLSSIASLAAIVAELSTAKLLSGVLKAEHIGLAGATVLLSWTFLQTMYALHYAHEFYTEEGGKIVEGLEFPGGWRTPDYWDFVYYSFVIGTAVATADINITSQVLRRVTTVHCVVAFFFNTTILALCINIGAGLF